MSVLFLLALAAGASTAPRPLLAVRLARLVNPQDGSVRAPAVVLIEGDRVRDVVGDIRDVPERARELDWSRWTGLPGLVDAHTHVTFAVDDAPGVDPWKRLEQMSDEQILRAARVQARATLAAGVTTVLDKGSSHELDCALRGEIASFRTLGPRLFVAGDGIFPVGEFPGGVSGARAVRAEVGRLAASGVDLIKVYADLCSDRRLDCSRGFGFDEIAAAVAEAHRLGLPAAVHSYLPEGAADAVRAWADSVEHAVSIDPATLARMAAQGTSYVPTIEHNRWYAEESRRFGYTAEDERRLRAFAARAVETTRAAHAAGVSIAMGSDAVFWMAGANARELRGLVEAGLTPMEALRAATLGSAASVGLDRRIGAILPGYLADLIAIEGDPLADPAVLEHGIRGVILGGELVDLGAGAER